MVAAPAAADPAGGGPTEPAETVVRKKAECNDGEFCITRTEVDVMNAVVDSEARCRRDLKLCRASKVPAAKEGWDPAMVVILGGVAVFVALGAGFAVGNLVPSAH